MKKAFSLAAIVVLALVLAVPAFALQSENMPPPAGVVPAKVIRVVDGDTIEVEKYGKVRYIGIDTPETVKPSTPVQPFGPEASAENKKLVAGKTVFLEFDVQTKDKYGRTLAYVWAGNTFVNAYLVEAGLARVATFPPNVKYVELFARLQKEAREAGRGMWGTSSQADNISMGGKSILWSAVKRLEEHIDAFIVVVGWIVAYLFNVRAQNKLFKNQVLNDARREIVAAIRDYEDWLGHVHVEILSHQLDLTMEGYGFPPNWQQKMFAFRELAVSGKWIPWLTRLEEHEILFPETHECRAQLMNRQETIREKITDPLMMTVSPEQWKSAMEKVKNDKNILFDQITLMEDLRNHIQNICLSSITGNKIPERKPLDPSYPRISLDPRGNLQVIEPTFKAGIYRVN